MLADLLGFPPPDGQLEAIRSLAIDQLDLILIAPTGWGKSVVFQAIPALRGGICLMIMPLNLLEEEQVSRHETQRIEGEQEMTNLLTLIKARSIARIPGCKPCVLNA